MTPTVKKLEIEAYLSKHFLGLSLERPLFYAWPVGLRFEIGPDGSLWKDAERTLLNEAYFSEALRRAKFIFEQVFDGDDDVIFVYQDYAPEYSIGGCEIKNRLDVFRHIRNIQSKTIIFPDAGRLNSDMSDLDEGCWQRALIGLKADDLDYRTILITQLNTDFGDRKPSFSGDCFFVNISRHIILNLYDDRGMDVVAAKKESLNQLYSICNSWILEYDREKIDEVFKT